MMELELTQIRTDGGTQPRATYHFGIVDAYAEDMDAGAVLPPVTVFYDGADYWLADGYHRVLATKKLERTTIEADVRQGTQQDAQWHSYSVNQAHGLRRSNEDKQRAVEAALAHPKAAGMSDREIADHCGVTHPFVAEVRKRITGNGYQSTANGYRTGKDGVKRKTPSKTPKRQTPAQSKHNENETTAPIHITDPTSATPDRLTQEVDRLVHEYSYDDLLRILEELAVRIGVNV